MKFISDQNLLEISSIWLKIYHNYSFADVPECQFKIASTPHVLDQLICIASSNQFIHFIALVVAETFLLLANDADAHVYLVQPDIIGALLQLYQVRTDVDVALLSQEEKASVTTLRLVQIPCAVQGKIRWCGTNNIPVPAFPSKSIQQNFLYIKLIE